MRSARYGVFLLLLLRGTESFWIAQKVAPISTTRTAIPSRRLFSTPLHSSTEQPPTGLYIHIPFCRRRCRYCDFAIVPIGDRNTAPPLLTHNYTQALLRELSTTFSTPTPMLQTVYFGGGTPSLAPSSMLQEIWQVVTEQCTLSATAEITMEMDPGTFDRDYLKDVVERCGINRVSLGVQSLDDAMLQTLGRVHTVQDVYEAVHFIWDVLGPDANWSMDLISGLPGQTLEQWDRTLQEALKLQPPHLSVYDLILEEGTVLDRWYRQENEQFPRLPTPDQAAALYEHTVETLHAYDHYEISSFAKNPKFRSRHNQIYWHVDGEWYAAGLGASSWVDRRRVERPRALADYLQWEAPAAVEPESDLEYLLQVVLKRLRTKEGLDLEWLEGRFGSSVLAQVLQGVETSLEAGLALVEGRQLRLTDPAGFLLSNTVIANIFAEVGGAEDASETSVLQQE